MPRRHVHAVGKAGLQQLVHSKQLGPLTQVANPRAQARTDLHRWLTFARWPYVVDFGESCLCFLAAC